MSSCGTNKRVSTINEYGLYTAILKSNKKEAVDFQRWITHEVLPSIQQTGTYSIGQPSPKDELTALYEEMKELEMNKAESDNEFKMQHDRVKAKINRIELKNAVQRLSPVGTEAALDYIKKNLSYPVKKSDDNPELPE